MHKTFIVFYLIPQRSRIKQSDRQIRGKDKLSNKRKKIMLINRISGVIKNFLILSVEYTVFFLSILDCRFMSEKPVTFICWCGKYMWGRKSQFSFVWSWTFACSFTLQELVPPSGKFSVLIQHNICNNHLGLNYWDTQTDDKYFITVVIFRFLYFYFIFLTTFYLYCLHNKICVVFIPYIFKTDLLL